MTSAEIVAKILLDEKAVFLSPDKPYTWTSGIISPVYCDNRLLISSVSARNIIVDNFCQEIRKLGVDIIAGTATAGIPWAAWIAQKLELPLVYIRSSTKDHGRQNAIEGVTQAGQKSVLIEDLISTGKSSIAAAKKLEEAQVEVTQVISIFTYGFNSASEIFKNNNLSFHSLSSFEILAKVAYHQKMLDDQALNQVLEWRKNVVFT